MLKNKKRISGLLQKKKRIIIKWGNRRDTEREERRVLSNRFPLQRGEGEAALERGKF